MCVLKMISAIVRVAMSDIPRLARQYGALDARGASFTSFEISIIKAEIGAPRRDARCAAARDSGAAARPLSGGASCAQGRGFDRARALPGRAHATAEKNIEGLVASCAAAERLVKTAIPKCAAPSAPVTPGCACRSARVATSSRLLHRILVRRADVQLSR